MAGDLVRTGNGEASPFHPSLLRRRIGAAGGNGHQPATHGREPAGTASRGRLGLREVQAIFDLPYFAKRSLIASVSSASVVASRSTASPLSCLCAAGASVAVTFFFPARVAA